MAIVNGSLQEGYKDAAWFAANPTLVLLVGQKVNLEQTGTYKLGDGTTQLSALSFLGGSGSGLSGLTTNKVLKATSATTAGDSNITDDGTNVGIGTTSASARLHVKGIDATSANYALKVDNSASSALLYVANNGSVGINGGVDSSYALTIGSKTTGAIRIYSSSFSEMFNLFDDGKLSMTNLGTSVGIGVAYNSSVRLQVIGYNAGTGYLFSSSNYEGTVSALSIDYLCNSGFGTNSQTAKVHIVGTDATATNYALKVDNSASSPLLYVRNDGLINIGGLTASQLIATDASKNLQSLDTATYPSLTELSYVKGATSAIQTQLDGLAPIASPTFTGTPLAPTASANTNNTQIATTAYVDGKSLFRTTTDSSTHTGTLTNTIIWSEDISNKLSSGDIAELISDVVRVSGSTAATIRYYLNSSASLSGATQIGLYTYGFSGTNIADFRRQLIVKSSTVIRVKGSVSGPLNDYSVFSNYADVTVNLASLHVIFAITLGNTGDQFLVSSRKMVR